MRPATTHIAHSGGANHHSGRSPCGHFDGTRHNGNAVAASTGTLKSSKQAGSSNIANARHCRGSVGAWIVSDEYKKQRRSQRLTLHDPTGSKAEASQAQTCDNTRGDGTDNGETGKGTACREDGASLDEAAELYVY